ncbi:sugar ABC transporter permease [Reticulibacter mediterranei]|uniref:Sugar ABC transporter permease n=1 Tax=Reticulibacter mediterranei TaxID=2778369 RepID=A0A8J3N5D3_9CHLR|nr:ABC transporter permease [Reticulibacter mediterranei]GHO95042.1 sugar ABC transporter permease [Reticulibacter mediterranei]
MSATETRTSRPIPVQERLSYYGAQNVPLLLSIGILVVMILLYLILFVLRQQRLPGSFELSTTLNNSMTLGLAALGQSLVVLTGGIDLSVGGIVDVTNSVAARLMQDNPGSIVGVTLLVLVIGAGAGLLNGLLVTYGRLQPIIVTIATLAIWQGVALLVLPQPGGSIPAVVTNLLAGDFAGLPASLIIFILLILFWQVLRRTPFLVTLYAIGNDERAARANGASVELAKVGAYMLGGVFAGAAGLYLAASSTSGDATTGTQFTLTSIAAVVLGGISLFGGRGSAVGSLIGACILTLLLNVLFFAGVNPQLQEFFQGLFLILAVVVSTLIRRLLQSTR